MPKKPSRLIWAPKADRDLLDTKAGAVVGLVGVPLVDVLVVVGGHRGTGVVAEKHGGVEVGQVPDVGPGGVAEVQGHVADD